MRRRTLRTGIGILVVGILMTTPLFAIELDSLLAMAKEKSPSMRAYEVTRLNSEISTKLAYETEDTLGVEVSSGNLTVSYNPESVVDRLGVPVVVPAETVTSITPSVTLTLPNDGKTSIGFNAGTSVTFVDGGQVVYNVVPTLSASHTFSYGKTTDDRSDLLYTQSTLLASLNYSNSVLSFENQVYQKLATILTLEQQLRTTQKNIDDLQTSMDNALKLGTYSKDSVTYASKVIQLDTYKNNLNSQKLNYQYNLDQYKAYTGLEYEPVTGIRQVTLNFSPFTMGNTQVLLKQLALQIAEEDLSVEQSRQTNSSLRLNGSLGIPVAGTSTTTAGTSITGGAGLTYSGSNFSVSGSTSMNYSITDNAFSPSVTVSGKWSNNTTTSADTLKLQQLENKVLLAQLDYQDALIAYNTSAMSMQNEIIGWNLSVAEKQNEMKYHQQVLEQKQALLETGLGKQSDVDAARFTVEQDQYEWQKLLLDGLVLENKVRMLQL